MHMEREHKAIEFECDTCDFRATAEDKLKNHKIEKHKVKCDHCAETFLDEKNLTNMYAEYKFIILNTLICT